MFEKWKQKREEKKAKDRAIAESGYWKNHPGMRRCLQAMRGSCTVAPMELHEAVIAVVNIALAENTWAEADRIPADFLSGTVYLVWNDEKLPVLKAPWELVTENLDDVRSVAERSFLISETMDRIVYLENNEIKLYAI